MNGAHLHLALNHFPVVALSLALLFLLFAWMRRHAASARSGLFILVACGLMGLAAFFTGEPAEDTLKLHSKDDRHRIHEHEEAGELAIWVIEAAALLSVFTLWRSRRSDGLRRVWILGALFLNVAALAVVARTNLLGGEISHPEIRGQAEVAGAAKANEAVAPAGGAATQAGGTAASETKPDDPAPDRDDEDRD